MTEHPQALTADQRRDLLNLLETRFRNHRDRHPNIEWAEVRTKLENHPEKLRSLHEMERTGGEPDVVGCDPASLAYLFCDCSPESPAGRRSLCYDREAWESRKNNRPQSSAIETAALMGVEILTEAQYRVLQDQGEFDTKTSSWVATPGNIRELGGALFGDRRYGRVFIYHNGAESYYASRGFRGMLRV